MNAFTLYFKKHLAEKVVQLVLALGSLFTGAVLSLARLFENFDINLDTDDFETIREQLESASSYDIGYAFAIMIPFAIVGFFFLSNATFEAMRARLTGEGARSIFRKPFWKSIRHSVALFLIQLFAFLVAIGLCILLLGIALVFNSEELAAAALVICAVLAIYISYKYVISAFVSYAENESLITSLRFSKMMVYGTHKKLTIWRVFFIDIAVIIAYQTVVTGLSASIEEWSLPVGIGLVLLGIVVLLQVYYNQVVHFVLAIPETSLQDSDLQNSTDDA